MFRQFFRNLGLLYIYRGPNLQICDAQQVYFVWKMQFYLCIRQLGADGYDEAISDDPQLAAEIPLGVLNEEDLAGCCAVFSGYQAIINPRIYSYNAAWKQIWERQYVVFTDLSVKKTSTGDS